MFQMKNSFRNGRTRRGQWQYVKYDQEREGERPCHFGASTLKQTLKVCFSHEHKELVRKFALSVFL